VQLVDVGSDFFTDTSVKIVNVTRQVEVERAPVLILEVVLGDAGALLELRHLGLRLFQVDLCRLGFLVRLHGHHHCDVLSVQALAICHPAKLDETTWARLELLVDELG
jgi:hypothetical protein